MTTIHRKFENLQQVKDYAQKEDKLILIHNGMMLDVTTFHAHHPGGGVLLRNSHLKDIEEELKFHHPLTVTMADTMAIGSFKKEIQKMIDPEKPLGPQIWHLSHEEYLRLVDSPHWLFVESPRFFETNILEVLSHNKWYTVPPTPLLMTAYNYYLVPSWETFNLSSFILAAILGLLIFSFTEYMLHRFLFHSEGYLPNSRILRYIHFFTHGVHHMLPSDPDRLVLPVPTFLMLYTIVVEIMLKPFFVISDPILYATVWSFFVIGYIIYDVSHYALHHIDTTKHKGGWFHRLQKYHNQHHFSGEYAGFGVSSPLWDFVFRTNFKNKKNQ